MDQKLSDFITQHTVISTEGMKGDEREALKLFYVSNHGIGYPTILKKLEARDDSRTLATARLLGIVDNNLTPTEIGKIFLSKCSDKKRIWYNQYKKWHFPNSVNYKGDANLFSIYPYWIILEFLVLARKKGIHSISAKEFIVLIATIRKRENIQQHLDIVAFLRENEDQREEFYSALPDRENLFQRFSKSTFHELLSDCLEFISYDTTSGLITLSNTDTEFLINQVNYFYQKYDTFTDFGYHSSYFSFLSSNIIDNTLNIFPMPNTFSSTSYTTVAALIKNDYPFRNILLKGVPGTGKSRCLEEIINTSLFGLKDGVQEDECLSTSVLKNKNVIRVNIHSGLSNSELMQGIGVMTTDTNEIKYYEKRGIILKHIAKAIINPSLPYVVILEEVQENNLNKLIGDLIFLIENDRRIEFSDDFTEQLDSEIDFSLVSQKVLEKADHNKVLLPSLIEDSQEIFLCIPRNLYFFCTSNYRDDKKIMEDNMLRRFEIIDLYPDKTAIVNKNVGNFFEKLNEAILKEFTEKFEIHPDRFQVGHAIWINVNDGKSFCQALNKVAIDFKDLKEIEWETFKDILKNAGLNLAGVDSYKMLLGDLQSAFFLGKSMAIQELDAFINEIFTEQ
ncbi:hypothetical protein EG347_14030 [Chryseobacterium sp. G0186]|uniref:hypothetical protein n=1 Tax=Chryseobacterium sp. G0186 TaxID=2487064 RepID=UPI000F504130|nr:hypothetical protein [Chryseobacterium sp. G0186]AZA78549.1 hypothetical protein EG347_14030 [Chryseobacterium sp. G0186]